MLVSDTPIEVHMPSFPTYDPSMDSIRLNGGASIMLTLLMKAKFGERFDPEILFHAHVADLIRQLNLSLADPFRASGSCFDRQDLWHIAKGVFDSSIQNGWWSKTSEERTHYLQDAAAPWTLSANEIEDIFDDIESLLFRSRQITSLAVSEGQ
jgi:hypothetical protein